MKRSYHFFTACVLSIFFLATTAFSRHGEDTNPLGFKGTWLNKDPDLGDTVTLVLKAKVPKGWHLYGAQSDCPPDDGPIRAEISLDSGHFTLLSGLEEKGSHLIKDTEVWNCSISQFADSCEFRLRIVVNAEIAGLKAHFYGQKCSDDDGMCLQVRETISIPLVVPHSRPMKLKH